MSKYIVGISTELNSDPLARRNYKQAYTLEFQNRNYSNLLRTYGATPVFLSLGEPWEAEVIVSRMDGLILSGGSDLDPLYWGESALRPAGNSISEIGADEKQRTEWEDTLLKAALKQRIPVFGICRGMQQINVVLGGSLWQDLESQLGISGHHNIGHPYLKSHEVSLVEQPGNVVEDFSQRFAVTSTHHQAVKRLGEGLRVFACDATEEKVVEGIYRDIEGEGFLLGVQWHPERMASCSSTANIMRSFFAAIEIYQS
jgi:putative glutamine amidotransferase